MFTRVALATVLVLQLVQACPPGFAGYSDSCYFFSAPETKLNWFEAAEACTAIGGRFASVESLEERNYIVSNVKAVCGDSAWIGGNSLSTKFRWFHNRELFTYSDWAGGEPNNDDSEEFCVELRENKDYKWNDQECFTANCYVCESP